MKPKINIKHFKQLTADREDSLRLLNKSSMRGIRDSVVERYSEEAHFVYELLQNADDVLATWVRFVLQKDGFYFIHNGQIPFTVTAPNSEKSGHINAITAIGASSKKDENYKIGKFEIGFKSVFQYTQTPYVYDENVAFRIRDLIVPELLDESSHPMRGKDETLFYFPFNHEKKKAKTAHFEIQSRLEAFKNLNFEDNHNLKTTLTPNINFVFGPPGTGKITHLATQEILPMMEGEKAMRILVLTPTNKSADVLARKVLALLPEPPHWLLRFGASGDNVVENAGLLCDNTLEINEYDRCCVITTATRYPYDGFDNGSQNSQLKNLDWDVIIIDEASMVTLAMVAFVLHQSPETQFIIAGDPFQIEPIVFAEEWKGENIYSMIRLNSFDPILQQNSIIPHQYDIHNLTTQYRSIPSLGHVFSNFAYENRLAHFRKNTTQRFLKLDNLELKPINIIRFPVNKLETLYRSQRLKGSHYHIYSALLTAELVKYLVEQIFKNHIQTEKKAKAWRIGIICPYKAQAQMVDKILAAQHVFKPKVSVSCGTIYSFQGDECDVMINLFNPPSYISKSPNMFLNRTNIINVGISRAKDYLILLIPDKETENVWHLEAIGRLLNIIRHDLKGDYWEKNAAEIEQILFNLPNYLEQNTFATTHQSINVYTEPEKQFEIRVEEMAVDVQVGRKP